MLGISPTVPPKQRLSPLLVDIHWGRQRPYHTHRSEASGTGGSYLKCCMLVAEDVQKCKAIKWLAVKLGMGIKS